jgi:hypothetical protein
MRWLGDRIANFLQWLALKFERSGEASLLDVRLGDHLIDTTMEPRKGRRR